MSLINDALKRASQAARNRPPQATVAGGMEPAAAPRRRVNPVLAVVAVIVLLAAAAWAVRLAMAKKPLPKPPAPVAAVKPAAPTPAAAPVGSSNTTPSPKPPAVPATTPAVTKSTKPNALSSLSEPPRTNLYGTLTTADLRTTPAPPPSSVSSETNPPPPASNAPENLDLFNPKNPAKTNPSPSTGLQTTTPPRKSGPFPELRLEGIFYNARNPRAIINGNGCGENEVLANDVLVVKIAPTKVTVQWGGQTKDIYLQPP